MSVLGGGVGGVPGMGTVVYEFQSSFMWDGPFAPRYTSAQFSSAMVDSGNTPTTTCRMGLVLGKITATNLWTNYSATATDGSQVAQGILTVGLSMTDPQSTTPVQRFFGVCVGGCVKASGLVGIDGLAREQMRAAFQFDDELPGRGWFPFAGRQFQNKTTNYVVVASDNGTIFTTTGGTGTNFTLPTLASGLSFMFYNSVDQNMTVTSAAGNDMFAFNDLAASSVAFSSGGAKIGGCFVVFSNAAGTAWHVMTMSAGANTVTVT